MEPNFDISAQELVEMLADDVFAQIAEQALSITEHRGGVAVGCKGPDGKIHLIVARVNEELPSRWGNEDDQYDLYASLKLGTALREEKDTVRLPKEMAPLVAVHPGGCVRYSEAFNAWFGVSYSGHHGEEDQLLASTRLENFFFNE